MVQRKAPYNLGSQAEPKRNHAKLERQSSSHQKQETRNKGGGDLRKMMKKVRSTKVSDSDSLQGSPKASKRPTAVTPSSPNYMRATSSSDARKEQLQVNHQSQITADKKTSPGRLKIFKSSRPSSSSHSGSGLRSSKTLSRQSSLKPVRFSMKKNSKNVIVNGATCSSTLKNTNFPKALDLNSGGTDAQGTSVIKVCPFTYCSLNGHGHAPLPPLKCFVSARRKLLKTQKSMKLKGLSSFRVKGLGKVDEKEIDTGQRSLEIPLPKEQAGNDFFVEIYTGKPLEQIRELGNSEERSIQTDADTKEPEDGWKCPESEVEEDDQMNDFYSDISFENVIDQSRKLSSEEMDVMTVFPEYAQDDQQVEKGKENHEPGLVREDYADWLFEETAENENKVSVSEATEMDCEELVGQFPDNVTECFEYPDDLFVPIYPHDEFYIESANVAVECEVENTDSEVYEEVDDTSDAFDGGSFEGNHISLAGGEEHREPESSEENEYGDSLMVKQGCSLSSDEEDISDSNQVSEWEVSEESKEGKETGHVLSKSNSHDRGTEPDGLEAQHNLANGSMGEEDNGSEEVGAASALFVVLPSNSYREITENVQEIPEGASKCDDATKDANICSEVPSNERNTSTGQNWEQSMQEEINKPKSRISITRKKTTEELEQMKEFNPRGPRFLPVEPDPEAEKVDLRHQMTEDRKNAEEWMIDYALQRTVSKLAPARKRKVALLVEAFETVMPSLQRTTSGFGHATPIQACS